eukprot:scaffold2455_cov387-Prasinococcus_capsulatus_cf.AAC.16
MVLIDHKLCSTQAPFPRTHSTALSKLATSVTGRTSVATPTAAARSASSCESSRGRADNVSTSCASNASRMERPCPWEERPSGRQERVSHGHRAHRDILEAAAVQDGAPVRTRKRWHGSLAAARMSERVSPIMTACAASTLLSRSASNSISGEGFARFSPSFP